MHTTQTVPYEPCRCECGSLLAKMASIGIELKCRRCKRIVVIRFADIEGWKERTPSPSLNCS